MNMYRSLGICKFSGLGPPICPLGFAGVPRLFLLWMCGWSFLYGCEQSLSPLMRCKDKSKNGTGIRLFPRFWCRLQSGLRLRSTLVEQGSRVLILFFGKMSRCPKKVEHWSKHIFLKMSKIHFPGLRTLRLAIWTTYFLSFPIFFRGS